MNYRPFVQSRRSQLIASLLFTAAFLSNGVIAIEQQSSKLRINDCVVAKINDNPITVFDIAKQLEGHLQHQSTKEIANADERLQFFNTYWLQALRDRIDRELILADADERKLTISKAEIGDEMNQLFGPDIADSLSKLNLTYEAALESVKREIIVRRMLLYRAHIPAQGAVGPEQIRRTYAQLAISHHQSNRWLYRIISINDDNEDQGIALAQQIGDIISKNIDWNAAAQVLRTDEKMGAKSQISEIYTQRDIDLSEPYRHVLQSLSPGSCSAPVPFTTSDGKTHYRLFYLIERENRPCPPLRQIAAKLREMLIEQRAGEIIEEYLVNLRRQYRFQLRQIEKNFPADIIPFSQR